MKKITISFTIILIFSIQFSFTQQTILKDSNLPIMLITTDINPNTNSPYTIPDEPKVPASLKIIYREDGTRNYLTDTKNSDFLNYNGKIGIELRGSSSQVLDKKPYGFTTLKEDLVSNNNVSLLGLPSENDWVLNSLAFDPSMIRDFLSYSLAAEMGNYAPRVKYVEVIVNDDYKGVYILTEKIKIDSDRVDLKKLSDEDNFGKDVTGGYIIKADKTTGGDEVAWTMTNTNGWFTEFIHHKPKAEDITTEQANYIESIFRELENQSASSNASIIDGYPSIIDIPSFVDYMIMAELASNPDSYQFSTYFHKDRAGKLRAGPIWDYNLSFGNDLFLWDFDRSFYNVWQFNYENTGTAFWKDLFDDTTFNCYLSQRWFELTSPNNPLNYTSISNKIDDYVNLLKESQEREQERWATVSDQVNNIKEMKTWIQNRIQWMNSNIKISNNCVAPTLPKLVISKIHYNPIETEKHSSKELEYIEITNNSNELVNLTGIYISELGVSYQFPVNSEIAANKKIYLSNDSSAFEEFYGFLPFDEFSRSLSNSSYKIVLADAFGNNIDEVHYTDEAPWPKAADGSGAHLHLNDLNMDNSLANNWSANFETLSTKDVSFINNTIVVYPNPVSNTLKIKFKKQAPKFSEIIIYDNIGKRIKSIFLSNTYSEINLSKLNTGLYHYIIRNKGNILLKNTFIKK